MSDQTSETKLVSLSRYRLELQRRIFTAKLVTLEHKKNRYVEGLTNSSDGSTRPLKVSLKVGQRLARS